MRKFEFYFLTSFAAASAVLVFAANHIHDRVQSARFAETFPTASPILNFTHIASPRQAKRRSLFWVTTDFQKQQGAAIDLLGNEELFVSVFPGYAQARHDRRFWSRYFGFNFDGYIYSPFTSERNAMIATSGKGSHELFSRYGGDFVIIGNSESATSLIPLFIQQRLQQLPRWQKIPPRILSITRSKLDTDTSFETTRHLVQAGHKLDSIIWGYSIWSAFVPIEPQRDDRSRLTNILSWIEERPILSPILTIRHFSPDWEDLVRLRFQTQPPRDPIQAKYNREFPRSSAGDPAAIARAVRQMPPHYINLEGMTDAACDMTSAHGRVKAVIDEMLKTADSVFIFIPPTTPLLTEAARPCYAPAVRRMLLSFSGPRVKVRVDDWKDFGMDWIDFVRDGADDTTSFINENHPNYSGAMKVTRVVADWIAKERSARSSRSTTKM